MRKLSLVTAFALSLTATALLTPPHKTSAAVQNPITRSQAEQRALSMINLTWTYSSTKNGVLSNSYAQYVTQPQQLNNVTTAQQTGIPYNWGGQDGIDSSSYAAPWTSFLDAVNNGAYTGNVNDTAGYGLIPGTAGIDCSGFVQATFNIKDSKISTSTMFNTYFTKINLSDIKHMDILDRPGDHVVIFDKWGTLNGVSGAFTYESTYEQDFGGIMGTKRYFLAIDDLNNGYIPGRYVNVVDDPVPTPAPAPSSSSTISAGIFAQIANVNSYANMRADTSTSSAIVGTIQKGTIVYLKSALNGWYYISNNGIRGWVYGGLIASIPSGKYVALNGAYQLNIRSNPLSTAQILGILSQGQYAEVLGYSDDKEWMKISI
ncbi:MAG: SH3 domain-containing protein, partial [Bacillota bacterium]|nr:SH3 domain-containing protein [Bacillota bacterium]